MPWHMVRAKVCWKNKFGCLLKFYYDYLMVSTYNLWKTFTHRLTI